MNEIFMNKLAIRVICILYPSFLVLTVSCGKPKSSSDNDSNIPDFKDQNLQGKFAGKSWEFRAGRAVEPKTNTSSPGDWRLTLISNDLDAPCDEFILQGDDEKDIIFSMSIEKGKTELNFSENGQTMTFVDWGQDPVTNYISTSGWIEFTEVATGSATGKIVSKYSEEYYVNGNFQIALCCEKEEYSLDYEICK